MNWKVIIRNIGFALLVNALFMLLAVFVSMAGGNDSALAALMISFTITFIVGIFPFIFVRKTTSISLREGYVIITLSWLLSFIFGLLPYVLWGGPFTLSNAIFESVSGYTTCGATILSDVEALPNSLLFWRSATHFIGGLGVVVFLLLLIPESSQMRMRLTNMELSSLSRSSYSSRTTNVVYIFAYVYLALFVLAVVAYCLAGMSFFDAVCHAMAVVATGGFSTKTASIAAFDSYWVEGVTMLFMYLSSIHFGLLYLTVVTRSLKPLGSPIIKFYTVMVLVVAFFLGIGLKTGGFCQGWGESFWDGLFNTLTVSSTTGFANLDNSQWPGWMIVLLLFPAIVCGTTGSTCGGIKSDRALILFKSIARHVNSSLHPSSVNEIRFGRRILRNEEVAPHLLYIGIYMMFILVSMLLALCFGVDFENSLVGSVMCLGNVGPGCGELMGSMGCYDSVSNPAKLLFSLDMFLGRVEIFPVLTVLGMIFDKRDR